MNGKILIWTDDPGQGGTALNSTFTAELLKQAGYEVCYVSYPQDTTLRKRRSEAGIYEIDLPYHPLDQFEKGLYSRSEAETILTSEQPDLVLFGDGAIGSSLGAKEQAQLLGIPFITVVNWVDASHASRFKSETDRIRDMLLASGEVVTVSAANLAALQQIYGLPASFGRVILNGRPDHFFLPIAKDAAQAKRRELTLPPDACVCLTVARFEPRKGYRYQLEALKRLRAHPIIWERLHFLWVGHDPLGELPALQHELDTSGLSDHVTCLKDVEDMAPLYGLSDLFILPSESEGMPLCITEAMAQGVPVIASAVSGIPEQLGEKCETLLPDPLDDSEGCINRLVEHIVRLSESEKSRRQLGEAMAARARELFSGTVMQAAYKEVIETARKVNHSTAEIPRLRWNDYQPGAVIDFSVREQLYHYIQNGWGWVEEDGCWTIGDAASLMLHIPAYLRHQCRFLQCELMPHMPSGAEPLDLRFMLNDEEIGAVTLTKMQPHCQQLRIPPRLWELHTPEEACKITLRVDNPRSPHQFGISEDKRLLGVKCYSFTLGPVSTPPPMAFKAALELIDATTETLHKWAQTGEIISMLNLLSVGDTLWHHLSKPDLSALYEPEPSLQHPPLGVVFIDRLMMALWRSRPDLQSHFTLSDITGYAGFLVWIYTCGCKEYAIKPWLNPRYLSLLERPVADSNQPSSPTELTLLHYLIWRSRKDLQAQFNLKEASGRQAMQEWAEREAV